MWTTSQRRTLILLVGVLSICILVRGGLNRRFVADPVPVESARAFEVMGRIDPNLASFDELVCLPMMGEKRAAQIVAYRERFLREHRGGRAFSRASDLMNVRGIGAGMVATFSPHLIFPQAVTSRPANGAAK
jgi:hypothetical protein